MKMLVGSTWGNSSDGKTIEVVNPATLEVIDTVPAATADDVSRAVTTAEAAQPAWAAVPVRDRVAILRRFSDLVREQKEELGKVLTTESGKPYFEEGVWEFEAVAYVFDRAGEIAMHHYGQTMPLGVEQDYEGDIQFTIHEPLGVIACVVPFNFPPAIWCYKVSAALAAGNAVVVKAPEQDPLSLLRCHELLVEAGVPAEVVQILTGTGEVAGAALVGDPRIAAVSFTGSTDTGIHIASSAAKHLTATQLELGGNDVFIVCEDAEFELAVDEAAGKYRNAGQACTAPKRFLVHESLAERFTEELVARLEKLKVGDPFDAETDMGPLIGEEAAQGVARQVDAAVAQGAVVRLGGTRSGAFYDPTVLTGVKGDMDIALDTEVFGPVWPIIEFGEIEEAIEIANASRYGLGGCVFSKSAATALQVAKRLRTGHIVINGSGYIRAAELPFGGGAKMSGNSRESMATLMSEVTASKSFILRNVLA